MYDAESFLAKETEQFRALYIWLQSSFSDEFLKEVGEEALLLMAHNLVGFKLQDYYGAINLANSSIIINRDALDSDLCIYRDYQDRKIQSMRTYVSQTPLPDDPHFIRIAVLSFEEKDEALSSEAHSLVEQAKTTDYTLCELVRAKDWHEGMKHSLELKLSCSEAPQKGFIGNLFKVLVMYGVSVRKLHLVFCKPDVLYVEAKLHGNDNKPCWESVDIQELSKELVEVRDFAVEDIFEKTFTRKDFGDGELLIFLRSVACFVQQLLVHVDSHMFSITNVYESFCYWPELAKSLYDLFCLKFLP